MRYLFIGLILLSIIGCGSGSTNSTESGKSASKPTTPITKDRSKQPPAIPDI